MYIHVFWLETHGPYTNVAIVHVHDFDVMVVRM